MRWRLFTVHLRGDRHLPDGHLADRNIHTHREEGGDLIPGRCDGAGVRVGVLSDMVSLRWSVG